MIHYSCDLCKRPLDADDDLRYVVQIEVYAAFDPLQMDDNSDDTDNLQELHDILERLDDATDPEIGEDVYKKVRYDLCSECRKRFIKNPLGKMPTEQFDFSKN